MDSMSTSTQLNIDELMQKQEGHGKLKTHERNYMKKFAAGKIIGLQNLIPVFQEQAEIVYVTDNVMVTELHEVDIEMLRSVINSNKNVLQALWQNLMPGVLLMLFN